MPFHRPIPNAKSRFKISTGVETLVEAEKLMQIAFLLPSATFIGWLLGAWADSRLHQSWIEIVGIIFGATSGLVYVIRMALTAEKSTRSSDETDDGTGKGSPNRKA
jgi:F0F1-type ATP synthase assembly protein I